MPRRTRHVVRDGCRAHPSSEDDAALPDPTPADAPPRIGQARSMSSFVIEAAGLSKSFGSTHALAGVDLSVRTGESLAIMGASGSGKTTLLHCLAGITAPDAGTVGFQSGAGRVEVTGLGERERSRLRREAFGFVFQQGLLIPELTAIENVALALMLNGMPRARAEEYARGWLAAPRPRRHGGPSHRPALGRAGAARGDRPRAGHRGVRRLRRRADRRARLGHLAPRSCGRSSTRRPARAARSCSSRTTRRSPRAARASSTCATVASSASGSVPHDRPGRVAARASGLGRHGGDPCCPSPPSAS